MPNFDFPPSPLEDTIKHKFAISAWLKREDKNLASGTFKDRKTMFIAKKSINNYALASSGNMAISFAKVHLVHGYGAYHLVKESYLWVSPQINLKKLQIIRQYYSEVNFTEKILTPKQLTKNEPTRWNITNGMDPIGASAYYSLGLELEPYNFDNIIVPCGSGELYSALAVYFNILRKKQTKVIPVFCDLPEADAINTKYVPCQPFIDHFQPEHLKISETANIINNTKFEGSKLEYYSNLYNCEVSSAVVFLAYDVLKPEGKTVLIITGAKK
jgi:threonine dehydratase